MHLSRRTLAIMLLSAFALAAVLYVTASVVLAWTGPTQAPPSGNVAAPINVGSFDQTKSGGIGVNALAVFGNAIIATVSGYLNFGSTVGATGYGFRDNNGSMEFKNNGGVWRALIGSSNGAVGPVTQIIYSDGTTQTTAADDSYTYTTYSINSQQQGTRSIAMGAHRYCALTRITPGGFNSTCQVTQSGGSWTLQAIDPSDSHPDTQTCGAICFD